VFLSVFVLILVASCFWQGKVWRTVRLDVADRPHGTGCSRTVQGQGADYPLFEVRYWRAGFLFRLSVRDPRIVRPYHADRPPGHRVLSAWCLAELLSPLLFDSCFRFEIVWGLFLGLVGP
jgi:hypothetical protein